ncbi:MAG: hypothetical protein J6X44_06240 [Thermoguttaceae bacterium]|nr:hypothetical protein [Thermoguttaceae bacterium]
MSIVKSPPEEPEDSYEEPTDRIEEDNGGGSEIDNSEEILYEFDKGIELTNTRPSRVQFENGKRKETNSWTDLYYWVVCELYHRYPKKLQEILHDNLRRGIIADFLDTKGYDKYKDIYRYSVKYIDENFYLNTNYNATSLGTRIGKWLKVCGLNTDVLKIYYVKKPTIRKRLYFAKREKNKEQQHSPDGYDHCEDKTYTKVCAIIEEHFSNGFVFDDSSVNLLENILGERIDPKELEIVKNSMFVRKDGVCFFRDLTIDSAFYDEILNQVAEYLNLNSGFESRVLYEKYRDHLNSSCIRSVEDFETWLSYMTRRDMRLFQDGKYRVMRIMECLRKFANNDDFVNIMLKTKSVIIKFSSVGKFRIARLIEFRNDDEFVDSLLQKIRDDANSNYGTIEENDIVQAFDGFSLEFLCHIVKNKADNVFVKKINESVCFQTFEGLGVPEDFSLSIQKALDKTDKLGLPPSLEVLTTLLAADLGTNPRQEYGIADDKAFKKLIEACYRGEVPRKWKSNVFGKD